MAKEPFKCECFFENTKIENHIEFCVDNDEYLLQGYNDVIYDTSHKVHCYERTFSTPVVHLFSFQCKSFRAMLAIAVDEIVSKLNGFTDSYDNSDVGTYEVQSVVGEDKYRRYTIHACIFISDR